MPDTESFYEQRSFKSNQNEYNKVVNILFKLPQEFVKY